MRVLDRKDYVTMAIIVLPLVMVVATALADLWYTVRCKAAGYDSGTTYLAGAVCFTRVEVPVATALAPLATPTR